MDEEHKLATALQKLSSDQVRLLARFAEILAEEQKADPIHDQTDVRVRYEQFRRWCAASQIDLAAVEVWATGGQRPAGPALTSSPRAK